MTTLMMFCQGSASDTDKMSGTYTTYDTKNIGSFLVEILLGRGKRLEQLALSSNLGLRYVLYDFVIQSDRFHSRSVPPYH